MRRARTDSRRDWGSARSHQPGTRGACRRPSQRFVSDPLSSSFAAGSRNCFQGQLDGCGLWGSGHWRCRAGQRLAAARHHRIIELRMIEHIEQFRPELQAVSLRDADDFRHDHIPLCSRCRESLPFLRYRAYLSASWLTSNHRSIVRSPLGGSGRRADWRATPRTGPHTERRQRRAVLERPQWHRSASRRRLPAEHRSLLKNGRSSRSSRPDGAADQRAPDRSWRECP